MSDVPATWSNASIGELNAFESRTIDPKNFPDEIFELYSVPSFPSGQPEIVKGTEIGSTKQEVMPGDVLLCKINPRINRVWTVAPITKYRQIASSEWIVIRNNDFDSRFVKYAFTEDSFRELLCTDLTGVGGSLTRAQPKRVATYEVPVAPLNEQKRIADKLDRQLARVDAAKARLDKIPPLLKRLRQAILAAATTGKLTEVWRAELDVSENWTRTAFENVLVELRNGLSPKPTEQPPGAPILRISAVRPGFVDTSDIRYLEIDSATRERYMLKRGDILFTRYNGSLEFVGVCGLYRNEEQEAIVYPDKLIRARVDKSLAIPEFIEIWFGAPARRAVIEGFVKSSAGQKGISGADLKSVEVLLPELNEQNEIIRRVEELFAIADRIEAQYRTARARVDRLTQSLLAKAFKGELVPQDPNDEPAAALLERIRAQRSEAPKAKRTRRKQDECEMLPMVAEPEAAYQPKRRGRPRKSQ